MGMATQDMLVHQAPDLERLIDAQRYVVEVGRTADFRQDAGDGLPGGAKDADLAGLRRRGLPSVEGVAESGVLEAEGLAGDERSNILIILRPRSYSCLEGQSSQPALFSAGTICAIDDTPFYSASRQQGRQDAFVNPIDLGVFPETLRTSVSGRGMISHEKSRVAKQASERRCATAAAARNEEIMHFACHRGHAHLDRHSGMFFLASLFIGVTGALVDHHSGFLDRKSTRLN